MQKRALLLLASGKQRICVEGTFGEEHCNLYNLYSSVFFAPRPDDLTGFSALIVSRGSRWFVLRARNGRTLLSAFFRGRLFLRARSGLYSGSLPPGPHLRLGPEGLSEGHVGRRLMKQERFSVVMNVLSDHASAPPGDLA